MALRTGGLAALLSRVRVGESRAGDSEPEAVAVGSQVLDVGFRGLVRGDVTGLGGLFEHALDVADLARRRGGAERSHDLVADAARQRRHERVFLSELADAVLKLLDLLEPLALLLGALGRDVGARKAQEVLEVHAELAGKAPDRAVGPVG